MEKESEALNKAIEFYLANGGKIRRIEILKICPICGIEKAQFDFYKSTKTKDGFQRTCKKCDSKRIKPAVKKYCAKINSTPKGKLSNSIRSRIWGSIKKNTKAGRRWESLVGYTVEQLQKHIEKQFKPGMAWGNYGSYWHIDHKVPIAVFNYERPEDIDFRLCWSLKNLQPLEATKNITKGAKIEGSFQPSLLLGSG
ncbi:MAG: hypothetical protein WC419_06305 [Candidatus Omnitrophota bacterium]|jgi:hypothetical protein